MDGNSNSVLVGGPFDNVKSQKLKALRNYRRKQAFVKTLIRVAEVCVALYLIFPWYSTTGATFAGDFLRRLVYLSRKPLCVFLFCHVIIATILILSVFSNGNGQNVGSNVYDEYVSHRRIPKSGYPPATEQSPEEAAHLHKQIISYQNSNEKSALTVSKRPVREVVGGSVDTVSPSPNHESSNRKIKSVSRPVLAIQDADEVVTVTANHSVSPIKDSTVGERKKGRRSRPGVKIKKAEKRPEPLMMATEVERKSVEELSGEEFKMALDEFIARTRMSLQRESKDEIPLKEGHNVVNNNRSLVVGK